MAEFLLSLSHMARNTLAHVFWTRLNAKKLLKSTFIDDNVDSNNLHEGTRIKKKFYAKVYQQLEDMRLSMPPVLKRQLRASIRVFGDSLFTSLKHLVKMELEMRGNSLHNINNFIENIRFTHSGSVDVSATFTKIYSAKPLVVDYFMWKLACELCLEEYILQWVPGLRQGEKTGQVARIILEPMHLCNKAHCYYESCPVFHDSYSGHFLMYWELWKSWDQTTADWSLFIASITEARCDRSFNDEWRIYDERDSIDENMFRVSVVIGNFSAVKYFWNKLTTEAKSTGTGKMIGIACHYAWKTQYPFKDNESTCDVYMPKRTQFFDIACFLIKIMPHLQLDELLRAPHNLEPPIIDGMCFQGYLPMLLLINHERYPQFCLNMAQKSVEHLGEEPFTYSYMLIIQDITIHSHHEAEIHGEDLFSILYECLRLTPIDSESKVRSYVLNLWSRCDLHFNSILDRIIDHPYSPKFVYVEDILERFRHIQWQYWADRFPNMPDVLNHIARELQQQYETASARFTARRKIA